MAGNVLLFHLNETSGPSFRNDAPGNPAQCVSACPTLGQFGQLRKAVTFNGGSSTIAYDDTSSNLLNFGIGTGPGYDFTVMGWISPGLTQNDTTFQDNSIIEKWGAGGGYPFVIRMLNQNAGANAGIVLGARYDTNNNPAIYSSAKVNDGRWHHVAFVKSGNTLYLYVDGNLQGSTFDSTGSYPCGFFGITCSTVNGTALYLGGRGPLSNKYTGGLDEVAVFNRGLSDAEIQNIYNHQSPYQPYAGYYQSRQMNAGRSVNWNTLTLLPSRPAQIQLPDNAVTETTFVTGNASMNGNVALYHFNEQSPFSGFTDTSGNGNTARAVYYYPTVGINGVYASAIGFTGGSLQGIRVNDSDSLHLGTGANSLTVEAWVKLNDASVNQKIVGKSPIGAGWILGVGNHQLYPEIWQAFSGQHFTFQAGFIPNNRWTHLAMTWSSVGSSGSQMFRGYVNGQMVDEVTTCPLYCFGILDTSQPMVIGSAPWDMSGYVMNGSLDEVAVYNRELTPEEIQAHYSRGVSRLLFQVRTCSTPCVSEPFIGPNGPSSYYSIQQGQAAPFTVPLNIAPNRVFQYQAIFDTSDLVTLPGLISVTVAPPHGAANPSQGECQLGDPVQCNLGTLQQGQVATVTISTSLSNSVAAGNLVNTGSASSDADDINPANNTASATTFIVQNVTLSVLKMVTPTTASFGQQVTYTILITNNGTSPANNVVVSDTLPQQFIAQPASSNQFACPIVGALMRCTAGALAANSTASIIIGGKAFPNASGVLANTAFVSSSEFLTGTSSTVELNVPVQIDLGVKHDPTANTDAGSVLVYRFTVTNSNASTAPNVVLSDTLDVDEQFDSATPAAGCSPSAGQVVCSLLRAPPTRPPRGWRLYCRTRR